MDDKTKEIVIDQMNKTYENFMELRSLILDDEKIEEDFEEIPMECDVEEVMPAFDAPSRPSNKAYPIICSSCGCKSTVPFEPQYASKVYCPSCFKNRNGSR